MFVIYIFKDSLTFMSVLGDAGETLWLRGRLCENKYRKSQGLLPSRGKLKIMDRSWRRDNAKNLVGSGYRKTVI